MDTQKIEALWAHLHWLIVLEQQGSFTAAAARLGVSKAAMSQRIAELERAAGVTLVRRTTRSVRLSEAGQRLVDATRAPFEQIAHSFSGVRDLADVPRGLLRVTAPVALARQQLVPHLAGFLRLHAEIRIELQLSDRLSSLAIEGFDLAIRHTAVPPDTHVAWLLCSTRSLLVASRAYLRRRGTPAEPAQLVGHDCLHYPRTQGAPAWTFERMLPAPVPVAKSNGKSNGNSNAKTLGPERVTVPIAGPLAANNSEALRDAAQAGLGIALLPDFSAQAALQSGKLVEVLPDWKPVGAFAEQLYAIRPYSAQVPRAVTLFVSYLREALAAGFRV